MPRPSRNLFRIAGARRSERIPAGAACPICRKHGLSAPVTHVVLSALERHYACTEHATRAATLGYTVFIGRTETEP